MNTPNLQDIFDNDEWNINNYLDDTFDDILYKGIEWLYDYENNEYDIYDEINNDFIVVSILDEIESSKGILKEYNINYTLDIEMIDLYRVFKNEQKLSTGCSTDLYVNDICEYFENNIININILDIPEDIEGKIINQYAIYYLYDIYQYNVPGYICLEYKKMVEYNVYRSRFINLYKKLKNFIKNKQKKVISKILNHKFNSDIIDNILYNY